MIAAAAPENSDILEGRFSGTCRELTHHLLEWWDVAA
jgi:hypothetical protein